MPRTALPLTSASFTDLHGRDGTKRLSSLQMELSEPAIHPASSARPRPTASFSPLSPASTACSKALYPIQPSEAVKSRRRSSAAAAAAAATTTAAAAVAKASNGHNAFALPPPPTRSRKIIQMKPRLSAHDKKAAEVEPLPALAPATITMSGKTGGKRTAAAAPTASEAAPSKKKQPSATSAAGRKIARKTAHSLIERRRRSKMNEEFTVLKGMIPACTGDMHKLAILQASIEYVGYLQDCIEKLQSRDPQTSTEKDSMANSFQPASYISDRGYQAHPQPDADVEEEEEEEDKEHSLDVEMANSEVVTPSPTFDTRPSSSANSSHQASVSPALAAQDAPATRHRHGSYASIHSVAALDYHHCHYNYSSSATTSPVWGGSGNAGPAGYVLPPPSSNAGSTLTSPALGPLRENDVDQEATAALLMLNSDRRGTLGHVRGRNNSATASGPGRGLSVRDLLSA